MNLLLGLRKLQGAQTLWDEVVFFKNFDFKQVSYENSNKLNKYTAKGGGRVCGYNLYPASSSGTSCEKEAQEVVGNVSGLGFR